MAQGINKVILIGNLGRDPELRYTQNGTAVANFPVATTEVWVKDGQKNENTEWHRVVAWARLAENCNQYLQKGRQVYVEGRIQTRKWEDRDGNERYTTEIIARDVQFLGGPGQDTGGADYDSGGPSGPAPGPDAGVSDDDIPF